MRKEDVIKKGEINKRAVGYFSLVKIKDLFLVWISHVTLFLMLTIPTDFKLVSYRNLKY